MGIKYKLIYYKEALKDIKFWKKSGNKVALRKINRLLDAMEISPYERIGEVEEFKVCTRCLVKKD